MPTPRQTKPAMPLTKAAAMPEELLSQGLLCFESLRLLWRAGRSHLDDPVAQVSVLSSHQFLSQIVAEAIRVFGGAGEMMIDSHFRRTTEIVRHRKNFVRRVTLRDLVLSKRASRANRKQLGCDSNKTREQQLLAIEFRTESRNRVKEASRQTFACAR